MITVVISVLAMALAGAFLGVLIGYVAKLFAVNTDPRIEEVAGMLPGANCGGCGFAGCCDLAKAIVEGRALPSRCPVCSVESVNGIASYLGIGAGDAVKKVAVVMCGGGNSVASRGVRYNGVKDCVSASLVAGGPKGCPSGCLGFASCARACPFSAIEMVDGLAVVNDKCVACGKCVEVCPRHLIKLVPASVEAHVFCSNSIEKGPVKKTNCSVACIACRKCLKAAGEKHMMMTGFLARVNYDDPPAGDIVEKAACPTNCLRKSQASVLSPNVSDEKEAA